jgi:hypothetical protein
LPGTSLKSVLDVWSYHQLRCRWKIGSPYWFNLSKFSFIITTIIIINNNRTVANRTAANRTAANRTVAMLTPRFDDDD